MNARGQPITVLPGNLREDITEGIDEARGAIERQAGLPETPGEVEGEFRVGWLVCARAWSGGRGWF